MGRDPKERPTALIWPSYDPRRYQPTAETLVPPPMELWKVVWAIGEEAKRQGWKVYCDPLSTRWNKLPYALPNDPGFPPLLLLRPPRLLIVAVSERVKTIAPETQSWLDAFGQCRGVEIKHWSVEDWFNGTVHRELSEEAGRSRKASRSGRKQ